MTLDKYIDVVIAYSLTVVLLLLTLIIFGGGYAFIRFVVLA